MAKHTLLMWLILLVAVFSILLFGAEAQRVSCKIPGRQQQQGLCVPIQRCNNIYKIVTGPASEQQRYATYIRKAACTLPNVERSICCRTEEVTEARQTTTTVRALVDKMKLLPEKCGQTVNDRIAHGEQAAVFAYPWMAVLQYDENGSIKDGCGGSLINKRYILTAAHCIKTRNIRLINIRLGEHTKNQDEDCNVYGSKSAEELDCAPPVEDYEIESSVIHPDYNRPKYSNDIGLIRLKRDVEMKDHIHPICLPVTPELRNQSPLPKYEVTGWGTTENQTGSNVLMKATLNTVSNIECQRKINENRLNAKLSDKQMCAGGHGKVDACQGDSGGPLGKVSLYKGESRYVQFGIVSFGIKSCGYKSVPGVYCRVASYIDWILDNMEP